MITLKPLYLHPSCKISLVFYVKLLSKCLVYLLKALSFNPLHPALGGRDLLRYNKKQ